MNTNTVRRITRRRVHRALLDEPFFHRHAGGVGILIEIGIVPGHIVIIGGNMEFHARARRLCRRVPCQIAEILRPAEVNGAGGKGPAVLYTGEEENHSSAPMS